MSSSLCLSRPCAAPVRVRRSRNATVVVKGFKGPLGDFPRLSPKPSKDSTNKDNAPFRNSVDVMLNRAASTLVRGHCTCLQCRGAGAVPCAHCKGAGRLHPQAVDKADGLRGVVRRLRSAMGLVHDVPYATSEWMVTNRCHRCHGTGSLPCELCTGSGLRYPHLSADHYRQCAGQPGAAGGAGGEGDCPVE